MVLEYGYEIVVFKVSHTSCPTNEFGLSFIGMPDELKDKTIFTPLDYHYKSFSCGFGPDFGKNNRILEVIGHAVQDWGNREMISMFAPLNVFCWWNRINDETLHLYFNQKMQLQLVKNWIKNSPHELQFKEKVSCFVRH